MVIATAGTTILGAFDPIKEIYKITSKKGIWLHVDASWGGSVIFSNSEKRKLLQGIEKADSIVWNMHQMLKVPLQSSIFLTPHGDLFKKVFSADNSSQNNQSYPIEYDLGEQSFQSSRRIDSLKLWLPWKVYGDLGYQKHIDRNLQNAQLFAKMVKEHPEFKLVTDPIYANVCFWYLPQENLTFGQLNELAPKIKGKLLLEGKIMLGYHSWGDHPNFFRMIFHDSRLTESDLKQILWILEETGKKIYLDLYAKMVTPAPNHVLPPVKTESKGRFSKSLKFIRKKD